MLVKVFLNPERCFQVSLLNLSVFICAFTCLFLYVKS